LSSSPDAKAPNLDAATTRYEQQFNQIVWTVEPAIETRATGYIVSITSDAGSKQVSQDKAARALSDADLSQPGDYKVQVSAVTTGGATPLAVAEAAVILKPLPYTQIQVADIQPDASLNFLSVIQSVNESAQTVSNGGFINSDFVKLEKMFDDAGAPVTFTAAHKGQIFQYRYRLNHPVEPGQPLMYASLGSMSGLIRRVPATNTYFYRMDHSPNAKTETRRIELHRLPPGATLVSTTPDDLQHRLVDGRQQIFIDTIVPPGGHVLVAYQYRLAGPAK